MQQMSPDFHHCWQAAGMHLSRQVEGGISSWLRAHPYPPFREHLSFRLGNQLFFVRIEDVDGLLLGPGHLQDLLSVAQQAGGVACILPMKRTFPSGEWVADQAGWGLLDAKTGQLLNPVALVSEEKIDMSSWELQDMAVQVVRDHLQQEGYQLISWQGDPAVDPAIWFIGASQQPEWVVVRAARFPVSQAVRPNNGSAIAQSCKSRGETGHFASVALVSMEQAFKSDQEAAVPLWRGHGMYVRFTGLESFGSR
jgi:hypothetical protein